MDSPVFAIDVGGVLASLQHDGQPRDGAQNAVSILHKNFDVWVVSQCGKQRALDTQIWLEKWGFGIPLDHQIYVPFKDTKTPYLEGLKAQYFVDDRLKHVIPALNVSSIITVFHLSDGEDYRESKYRKGQLDKYEHVTSWSEILINFGGSQSRRAHLS